jgi:hypothetical protein
MIGCDSTARRLIAALSIVLLLAGCIAALSIVLLLAGCARVRPADPRAAGVDLSDINAKLAGHMVRVRLVDGTELIAHDVRISADSVFLRPQRFPHLEAPWPAREGRELPISEVHSIEVTRRGRGAADGALIGLGVGAAAGAAIGASWEDSGMSTGATALVLGTVFGVLGTGVGLIIGVGLGSAEVFDLTKAPLATGSASTSQ